VASSVVDDTKAILNNCKHRIEIFGHAIAFLVVSPGRIDNPLVPGYCTMASTARLALPCSTWTALPAQQAIHLI